MTQVEIFTDGACRGNPGPGAWGAVLRHESRKKEISGFSAETTNNQMELTAVIKALHALTKPCKVLLTTDSKYVQQGIQGWIHHWKKNGWRTANKKPVKNRNLWEQLDAIAQKHDIEWYWIKGHSGHRDNERADELANIEIEKRIG